MAFTMVIGKAGFASVAKRFSAVTFFRNRGQRWKVPRLLMSSKIGCSTIGA